MPKTIIIPDVHHKIDKVNKILDKEQPGENDLFLSLGDWFDDFGDSPAIAIKTAEYVLKLQKELGSRFKWLLGNHDLPYVYPALARELWCSGVTEAKLDAVKPVLEGELDKTNVALCHIVESKGRLPVVISHAGVHKQQFFTDKKITVKKIKKDTEEALWGLNTELTTHNLLHAGKCRGGILPVGGIVWLDWYHEFVPQSNINQIVGHSTQRDGYAMVDKEFNQIYANYQSTEGNERVDKFVFAAKDTFNLCLDTQLNHYSVLEGDTLKIYDIYDI